MVRDTRIEGPSPEFVCDYFTEKAQLDLALFDPHGPYTYVNGYNVRAIMTLVLAITPVVPGFLRAATTPGGQVVDPGFFDTLYTYAWFVTFALGFVLYYVLMKSRLQPQYSHA